MIDKILLQQLATLGLSKYEACAYLSLLGYDDSSAVVVAERANVPRQRVYDVLTSLRQKGLVMIREGRPVLHTAREPNIAFDNLLKKLWHQQKVENDHLEALVQDLISKLEANSIKVIESPRPKTAIKEKRHKPLGGF